MGVTRDANIEVSQFDLQPTQVFKRPQVMATSETSNQEPQPPKF
jgi:hypothetical protein